MAYLVVGFVNKNLFVPFCPQKANTPLLRTLPKKSDVQTITLIVLHHINILADKKIYENKKRTKPDKNVYCVQRLNTPGPQPSSRR